MTCNLHDSVGVLSRSPPPPQHDNGCSCRTRYVTCYSSRAPFALTIIYQTTYYSCDSVKFSRRLPTPSTARNRLQRPHPVHHALFLPWAIYNSSRLPDYVGLTRSGGALTDTSPPSPARKRFQQPYPVSYLLFLPWTSCTR